MPNFITVINHVIAKTLNEMMSMVSYVYKDAWSIIMNRGWSLL